MPHRLLAGPWAHADPDDRACPGRGSTSTSRWRRGSTAGCAAVAPDERTTTGCDVFVRTSTRPEPRPRPARGLLGPRRLAVAGRLDRGREPLDGPRVARRSSPDVGTAAWIDCAGHLPWGLSGDQRARRRPLADLGARARRPARSSASRACRLAGQRRRAGRLAVGEAVRRLPRRHLGAGHPRHASTWPSATACTRRRPTAGPGHEYDVEVDLDACAYQLDARQPAAAVSVAGADWPNTIAPPAPVTLTVHGGSLDAAAGPTAAARRADVHRRAPSTRPRTPTASPGR